MSTLPAGTVTFLFSDVEGSTRLLHELGTDAYADALAEHRRVVREACSDQGAVEVDTQGDAFFFAFATAPGALDAAQAITKHLASGPIRVRIGLHTGTPLVTDEGYVGQDVHRAARIAGAGHGGQVLVSASTAALVSTDALRDLGEHRFKDLAAADRVYQLGERHFPSLKSLYRTNLPVPATPFLGRERELTEVVELLLREDVPLLTLTGPGGTGKTRLALQAAAERSDGYPDGIWWVPLAPLRDAALVLPAVAAALGLKEEPGEPLTETLADALAAKKALFLLDNVEHLLPEVAGELAALASIDGTALLATSRERIQVQGEHVYPVPTLEETDGFALFLARARALRPGFRANAAVAELCSRLDYLPLALELAAARTVVFSPEQLLGRLSQRLDLLKGGRDVDPRQQTLRATIAWSYDLLDAEEQRLFRSLSIFAGGCTYETAEDVCGATPDTLQSLLDKSLVRRRDTELGPRYWMLETIREFAGDGLEECDETVGGMQRLLEHLAVLAEAVEQRLGTSEQATAVTQLEAEHDNARATLGWALASGHAEPAVRLAAAMGRFWMMCDHLIEGRRWIESALEASGSIEPVLRVRALIAAGNLVHWLNDQDRAEERYDEAALLARELGEHVLLAYALNGLGNVADERNEVELSVSFHERALDLFRTAGDKRGIRVSLNNLGERAMRLGDSARARQLLAETIGLAREVGDNWALCISLDSLGALALEDGDPVEAAAVYREALSTARASGFRRAVAYALAGLSAVAALKGAVVRSGRLWGALETLEADMGFELVEAERARYERLLQEISASHPESFADATREGRLLAVDEAIEYALDDPAEV